MMCVNHSCDPNLGLLGQIVFVARREIPPGEELTMDYAMTDDDEYDMQCLCGTAHCRGKITGQGWRRPDLQKRYRGYFSSYLAAKIKQVG